MTLHTKLLSIGLWLFVFLGVSGFKKPDTLVLTSPNGQNKLVLFPSSATVNDKNMSFAVQYNGKEIILPSVIQLSSKQIDFNGQFSVTKTEKTTVKTTWRSAFSERSTIPDHYNQLKVYLQSDKAKWILICRAYNEGIAFSYEIPKQNSITEIGLDENVYYNFKEDYPLWSTPKRVPGALTAQGEYKKIPMSQLQVGCDRPLVIEMSDNIVIALAEAKLVDYARLSFSAGNASKYCIVSSLDAKIAAKKQDTITGADLSDRLKGDKVMKQLPFQSPWRVVMTGKSYGQLLENNYIIQNLNDPCALENTSWIKPGKLLRETTLTTQGAMSAIDFVAAHNMQYIMFDAGWYGDEMKDSSDATTVTLDPKRSKGPLDMEVVSAYCKQKNIGLILYVNRRALEKQLDTVLPLFKKWGVSGIKYGFVRVGDQDATAWLHKAVKKAADYQMIIDVHDEYRPTGFSRTYPNFLTQEGIRGDEETVPNKHTLITMFTRMLAGAADNTICYYNKRVEDMGSHASQLAKAVCLFSPLQSVYWYDSPAESPDKLDALWGDTKHIGNEPELKFFDAVPTTWDETKVLVAKVEELGVIARRKGNDWFIGGINGTAPQNITLDFSFLEKGKKYKATIYTDDATVKTRTRVKIEEKELTSKSKMKMDILANNGFAIQLVRNDE